MTARTRHPRTPLRVRTAHMDRLEGRLSARDWLVMETVNALGVMTGQQLERACFSALGSQRSRTVTRSRVLARLVQARVLVAFGRQVGGSGRGSTTPVYALDTAGRRLVRQRQLAAAKSVRVRRPGAPSERTLRHRVAVSELYADLVTGALAVGGRVTTFRAEPGSWWPNGLGGVMKPDAYVVLEHRDVQDHWWAEVDLATESLPVVRGKLRAYVDFREGGALGPEGVVPWLVIATTTAKRRAAIAALVRELPEAEAWVWVVELPEAARTLLEVLRE